MADKFKMADIIHNGGQMLLHEQQYMYTHLYTFGGNKEIELN